MRFRMQIFLGFTLVIIPPLISAIWSAHGSDIVDDRLAHLNSPLFPIFDLTIEINLEIDSLINFILLAGYDPEDLEDWQHLTKQLDRQFGDLTALDADAQVMRLHEQANQYGRKGSQYIKFVLDGESKKANELRESMDLAGIQLIEGVKEIRARKRQEFSQGLNLVGQVSRKSSFIIMLATSLAFGFCILLAYALARKVADGNRKLAQRLRDIYQANERLENEVVERQRVEQALRSSMAAKDALARVSKLFTATYSPNLRRVARILGEVVSSDLAFVAILNEKSLTVDKTLEWIKGEQDPGFQTFFEVNLRNHPNLLAKLSRNEHLIIEDAETDQVTVNAEVLKDIEARALLIIPIMSKERVFWGYMGFAQLKQPRSWTEEDIHILEVSGAILSNFLARQKAETRLKHDAFHDHLSGLPNRALFMDRLKHAIQRKNRNKNEIFSVMFLDLDRFKPINDTLGHQMGDLLLIQVAGIFGDAVREVDTVARLGGDEFAILLEDLHDLQEAELIATRIIGQLSKPFDLGGQKVHISISIGVVQGIAYTQADEILRDADIAMYNAKNLGGSCYTVFNGTRKKTHPLSILELEHDLHQAVKNEEFVVYYQPLVSLENNTIMGFEALVRWQHPKRGLVLPNEFIPMAEETGLIKPLGQWVLDQACAQGKTWHEAGFPDLVISVNVSAIQFYEHLLIDNIREILDRHHFPAKQLKLEITETLLMNHVEANISMLLALNAMGVAVSIDDFGTGYSSLSYLKRFPLHTLKIDRSFVRDLHESLDDQAITGAILAMARNLHLHVIAEGVETEEQLAFLRNRGCNHFQGFLFSEAVPAKEAGRLLMNTNKPVVI